MRNTLGSGRFVDDAVGLLRSRGLDTPEEVGMSELIAEFARQIGTADARFHDGPMSFQENLHTALEAAELVPGTPLLRKILSRGHADDGVGGACTVVTFSRSGSRERVLAALTDGTGVGVDLSEEDNPVAALRALNDDVLKLDNQLRSENRRPVACMATLSSSHPRVEDFIRAKEYADFMQWRFNISVRIEDYSAEREQLLPRMAQLAHFCGEPGMLFWDRVHEDSPTPTMLPTSTAPCAEVALADGEQCMFAYLNLVSFVTADGFDIARLAEVVALGTRVLDNATQICLDAADIKPAWEQTRRVGIGVMGYADALIGLGIAYTDDAAIELADKIARIMLVASGEESADLARTRGPFPLFGRSKYCDEQWLRNVYGRVLTASSDSADRAAIDRLVASIQKLGIRNSSTVALPPTGNASELTGVSKSLEPRRTPADITRGLEVLGRYGIPTADLDSTTFVTEEQISGRQHVRVQAAFQSGSIDAVSKTVNLPQHATVEDVAEIIDYAYETGCKGVTVFRDGSLGERFRVGTVAEPTVV